MVVRKMSDSKLEDGKTLIFNFYQIISSDYILKMVLQNKSELILDFKINSAENRSDECQTP